MKAGAACRKDHRIDRFAESLKILSDSNRLRIICLLKGGEHCVCEIERELGISQQLASHHLAVLKDAGFLLASKDRTFTYYRINRESMEDLFRNINRYLGEVSATQKASTSPRVKSTAFKEGAGEQASTSRERG